MKHSVVMAIAGIAALAGGAEATAAISSTATGTATVTIERRVGVDVTSPLVIPTVSTTAVVPVTRMVTVGGGGSTVSGTAVTTVGASRIAATGNATLIISGQSGDAVSMAVPETFKVIRTGGTETLTVKTKTNSEYDLARNGVVLGDSRGDTMSVNVGGAPALASTDRLVPGPYEGLLVVVVQYN